MAPVISYVKLNHKNFKIFETKLNQRVHHYLGKQLRGWLNVKLDMFLQPLAEIPFSQNFALTIFIQSQSLFFLPLPSSPYRFWLWPG